MSLQRSLNLREEAFLKALAAIEPAPSDAFVKAALSGFLMRGHVNECHAGQEAHCAKLAAPAEGEANREPWLFGYNFEPPN